MEKMKDYVGKVYVKTSEREVTIPQLDTLDDVIRHYNRTDLWWFRNGEAHGTRLYYDTFKREYLAWIQSDRGWDERRVYRVVQFEPLTGKIEMIGEIVFTLRDAKQQMKNNVE